MIIFVIQNNNNNILFLKKLKKIISGVPSRIPIGRYWI